MSSACKHVDIYTEKASLLKQLADTVNDDEAVSLVRRLEVLIAGAVTQFPQEAILWEREVWEVALQRVSDYGPEPLARLAESCLETAHHFAGAFGRIKAA